MSRRLRLCCLVFGALGLLGTAGPASATVATGHPRLLITPSDVTRLRAWATPTNPIYNDGLAVDVANLRHAMDDTPAGLSQPIVPYLDDGNVNAQWDTSTTPGHQAPIPTEGVAEVFAFMSLIDPVVSERAKDAQRAHDLLMYVIDHVAANAGDNWSSERFYGLDGDRARSFGQAEPLVVDWVYDTFTAAEKAKIRSVFINWANEQFRAYPFDSSYTGPLDEIPSHGGPPNSPTLIENQQNLRFTMNNYFAAHTRNLGLLATALDPADDPGGELHSYLQDDTGEFLFMVDHALRTQAAGGLTPEGYEYSPQTVGYLTQLLMALHTSGNDDAASEGQQVSMADNPFYDDFVTAFLHSLPATATVPTGDASYLGSIWLPFADGDRQDASAPDIIGMTAPWARYKQDTTGDTAAPNAARWLATYTPPGGDTGNEILPDGTTRTYLINRAGYSTSDVLAPIDYFTLFDPTAAAATDPRPGMTMHHFAPGINQIMARSCWCDSARVFDYELPFFSVDHQHGEANAFGFWRNGEWLTTTRNSYCGDLSGCGDSANTVAIQNGATWANEPQYAGDYRDISWLNGTQFHFVNDGPPTLVAHSFGPDYTYATGDATGLYNFSSAGLSDVTQASRSIVWLSPDRIIIYDRASTGQSGTFKRFWLQLPAAPTISGDRATATTSSGQQLFTTMLMPADATMSGFPEPNDGFAAQLQPMGYRLKEEATTADVRFLNVLQGADAGASAAPSTALHSSSGTAYDGEATDGTAVLFARNPSDAFTGTAIELPAGITRVLVTGLAPSSPYTVTLTPGSNGVQLDIAAGGDQMTDSGGVLDLQQLVVTTTETSSSATTSSATTSSATTSASTSTPVSTTTTSSGPTATSTTQGTTSTSTPTSTSTTTTSSTQPSTPTAAGIRSLLLSRLALGHAPNARRSRILAAGGYSLMFTAPEAGEVRFAWYLIRGRGRISRRRPQAILVASGSHRFMAAGTARVDIILTGAGARLLAAHRNLALSSVGIFTPAGRAAITARRMIRIR